MTLATPHEATTTKSSGKARNSSRHLVSGNTLATHLGMTRQNVARLTVEGVLERLSDGRYDLDASRLKYIKHLRDNHRRSPKTEADAEFTRAKTALLQLRVNERMRTLVPMSEATALIDDVVGMVTTNLNAMPAKIAGLDLSLRRRIERAVYDTRVAIAEQAERQAAACAEGGT
jgi:hypothetical protein